jgi:hypothetical protein
MWKEYLIMYLSHGRIYKWAYYNNTEIVFNLQAPVVDITSFQKYGSDSGANLWVRTEVGPRAAEGPRVPKLTNKNDLNFWTLIQVRWVQTKDVTLVDVLYSADVFFSLKFPELSAVRSYSKKCLENPREVTRGI